MTRRTRWASFGAIVAMTLSATLYVVFGVVGISLGASPARIDLHLANASGLVSGSPVLLNGVRVGEVTQVRSAHPGVLVRLDVSADARLPVDSVVTVETLSGLGEPFLRFSPTVGTAPFLADGDVIDTEKVDESLSIPDVARLLTSLLDQLPPDDVRRLVDTIETGLDGTDGAMRSVTRASRLVSEVIDARLDRIGVTYDEIQSIAQSSQWLAWAAPAAAPPFVRFAGRVDEIARSLHRLFDAGGGDPAMYVRPKGLVPTLQHASAWMTRVGPDLAPLVPALAPLAGDIANTLPRVDLGRLVGAAVRATDHDALAVRIHVR